MLSILCSLHVNSINFATVVGKFFGICVRKEVVDGLKRSLKFGIRSGQLFEC